MVSISVTPVSTNMTINNCEINSV